MWLYHLWHNMTVELLNINCRIKCSIHDYNGDHLHLFQVSPNCCTELLFFAGRGKKMTSTTLLEMEMWKHMLASVKHKPNHRFQIFNLVWILSIISVSTNLEGCPPSQKKTKRKKKVSTNEYKVKNVFWMTIEFMSISSKQNFSNCSQVLLPHFIECFKCSWLVMKKICQVGKCL